MNYEEALRLWASAKTGIDVDKITEVELTSGDETWGGGACDSCSYTDVNSWPEVQVHYIGEAPEWYSKGEIERYYPNGYPQIAVIPLVGTFAELLAEILEGSK